MTETPSLMVTPTGNAALDELTGIGGWPNASICSLYGHPHHTRKIALLGLTVSKTSTVSLTWKGDGSGKIDWTDLFQPLKDYKHEVFFVSMPPKTSQRFGTLAKQLLHIVVPLSSFLLSIQKQQGPGGPTVVFLGDDPRFGHALRFYSHLIIQIDNKGIAEVLKSKVSNTQGQTAKVLESFDLGRNPCREIPLGNYRSAAKSMVFAPSPAELLAEAKDLKERYEKTRPRIKQYFDENSVPLDDQAPAEYTEQTIKLPWE